MCSVNWGEGAEQIFWKLIAHVFHCKSSWRKIWKSFLRETETRNSVVNSYILQMKMQTWEESTYTNNSTEPYDEEGRLHVLHNNTENQVIT